MKTAMRAVGMTAVVLLAVAAGAWASPLVVDDFDSGSKPNALGGDFGAWDRDPNDATQFCHMGFDKDNAFGGVGFSLRLDYDVDSSNPAYNGFWAKLNNLDASGYKQLSFYVKGDSGKGYTSQIKLELKNDKERGTYLLRGVTDQWQKATIPLQDFSGITDWSKLTEFVVVFDDINSTQKVGTLYLDDVVFEN